MGFFTWFSREERQKRKTQRASKRQNKVETKARNSRPLKIGLALGGGGTRGFGHIGVLKAFKEYNIEFDYIAGTSVGALIGALYANNVDIDYMIDIAVKLRTKDILTSKIPLIPSKTEKLEAMVTENIGDIDLKDLKKPFAAVATDLVTGEEVALREGSAARAIAGSCAIPGVFNPVIIDGMHLVDGCLKNTVPSDVVRDMGADIVIGVDLNSARGYGTGSMKYIEVMMATLRILMKTAAVKGYVSSDYMVMPDLKKFKQTRTEGADSMIEEGYNAAITSMPEILAVLGRQTVNHEAEKIIEKIKSFESQTKVRDKDKKILDAIENDDFGDLD